MDPLLGLSVGAAGSATVSVDGVGSRSHATPGPTDDSGDVHNPFSPSAPGSASTSPSGAHAGSRGSTHWLLRSSAGAAGSPARQRPLAGSGIGGRVAVLAAATPSPSSSLGGASAMYSTPGTLDGASPAPSFATGSPALGAGTSPAGSVPGGGGGDAALLLGLHRARQRASGVAATSASGAATPARRGSNGSRRSPLARARQLAKGVSHAWRGPSEATLAAASAAAAAETRTTQRRASSSNSSCAAEAPDDTPGGPAKTVVASHSGDAVGSELPEGAGCVDRDDGDNIVDDEASREEARMLRSRRLRELLEGSTGVDSPASSTASSAAGGAVLSPMSGLFEDLPPVRMSPEPTAEESVRAGAGAGAGGGLSAVAREKRDGGTPAEPERRRTHPFVLGTEDEPLAMQLVDGEQKVIDVTPEFAYYKTVGGTRVRGTFVATNYMIRFRPLPEEWPHTMRHVSPAFFDVPLTAIKRLDSVNVGTRSTLPSKRSTSQNLVVHCKDGRCLRFGFDDTFYEPVTRVITQFAFPDKIRFVFAYYHRPGGKPQQAEPDRGWTLYDIQSEMVRLGVMSQAAIDGDTLASHRVAWRVYDNSDFLTCQTYPRRLIVPRQLTDKEIKLVAGFRSKGRIPTMTWMHPVTQATLWRSSQPRVGVSGNSCKEDEALLRYVRGASRQHPPPPLLIADCRPKANAVANKAAGMGYTRYRDTNLVFLHIHNIHAVRDSHRKVMSLCTSASQPSTRFWSDVDDTGWLVHVRAILEGSVRVANALHSDGWDRTSQVVSLAELMLDPYYRTIKGFCVLIAKQWLSFGHRFYERVGHASTAYSNDHLSPVFVQFLDCVYQLVASFQPHFEFSPRLLLLVADHLYSCRFGTFLNNCERDRAEAGVQRKTPSLFSFILRHADSVASPFYNPDLAPVLLPTVSWVRFNVRLWTDYFLRWCPLPATPGAIAPQEYGRGASPGPRLSLSTTPTRAPAGHCRGTAGATSGGTGASAGAGGGRADGGGGAASDVPAAAESAVADFISQVTGSPTSACGAGAGARPGALAERPATKQCPVDALSSRSTVEQLARVSSCYVEGGFDSTSDPERTAAPFRVRAVSPARQVYATSMDQAEYVVASSSQAAHRRVTLLARRVAGGASAAATRAATTATSEPPASSTDTSEGVDASEAFRHLPDGASPRHDRSLDVSARIVALEAELAALRGRVSGGTASPTHSTPVSGAGSERP